MSVSDATQEDQSTIATQLRGVSCVTTVVRYLTYNRMTAFSILFSSMDISDRIPCVHGGYHRHVTRKG